MGPPPMSDQYMPCIGAGNTTLVIAAELMPLAYSAGQAARGHYHPSP